MPIRIHHVARNSSGVNTHFGGFTSNGGRWGLSAREIFELIKSKEWNFYTESPDGRIARVNAFGGTLITIADGVVGNNLDSLPIIASPLESVFPQLPDAWYSTYNNAEYDPGEAEVFIRDALPFRKVKTTKEDLGPLVYDIYPSQRFWQSQLTTVIEVQCRAPYAAYKASTILAEGTDWTFDGVAQGRNVVEEEPLVWVSGNNESELRRIQNSGAGWFTWDLSVRSFDDPRILTPFIGFDRFMKFRFVMCVGSSFREKIKKQSGFLRYRIEGSTLNPNPAFRSNPVLLRDFFEVFYHGRTEPRSSTPSPAQIPEPIKRKSPDLIGKTVTDARALTIDASFKGLTLLLNGNLANLFPDDFIVATQDPPAGVESPAEYIIANAVEKNFFMGEGYSAILFYNMLGAGSTNYLQVYTINDQGVFKSHGEALPGTNRSNTQPLLLELDSPGMHRVVACNFELIGCSGNPQDVQCQRWALEGTIPYKSGGPQYVLAVTG